MRFLLVLMAIGWSTASPVTTEFATTETSPILATSPIIKDQPELKLPKGRNLPFLPPQRIQDPTIPNGQHIPPNAQILPIPVDGPMPVNGEDSLNYDYGEHLENIPDAVYPSSDDGDLASAETGLVFRPLFAYRQQIAKRKRLYGKKPTPSRRTGQRRRASHNIVFYPVYYYREPESYYYRPYYPNWYENAQWDTVA